MFRLFYSWFSWCWNCICCWMLKFCKLFFGWWFICNMLKWLLLGNCLFSPGAVAPVVRLGLFNNSVFGITLCVDYLILGATCWFGWTATLLVGFTFTFAATILIWRSDKLPRFFCPSSILLVIDCLLWLSEACKCWNLWTFCSILELTIDFCLECWYCWAISS